MASLIPFCAPAQTHTKKTLHQGAARISYRVGIHPKNVKHLREAECPSPSAAANTPKPSETALPRLLSIPRCSSGVFFELFRFSADTPSACRDDRLQRQPARSRHATGNLPLAPQRLAGCGSVDAGRTFPPARYCRKPARNQLTASQESPYPQGKKRRPLLRRTEHPHQDLFRHGGQSAFPPTPSGWRNPVPASRKAKA